MKNFVILLVVSAVIGLSGGIEAQTTETKTVKSTVTTKTVSKKPAVAPQTTAAKLAAAQKLVEKLKAEKLAIEEKLNAATAEKADAAKLTAEKAITEEKLKVAEKSLTEEKAKAEKLAAEKQAIEERLRAERLGAEMKAIEKAAEEKAEAEKLAAEKAEADRKARINELVSQYRNKQGTFNVLGGVIVDSPSAGLSGLKRNGVVVFNAPVTVRDEKNLSGWGLGFNYREMSDPNGLISSNLIFAEGRIANAGDQFSSTWAGRFGLNLIQGSRQQTGLAMGGSYGFHDLSSFYSFHLAYLGTVYNLIRSDSSLALDSNIESFVRLYTGLVATDVGADMNITNSEISSPYRQVFVRAGVRF